ncbi:alpha/beta hydrolase [Nocardioides sp. zg-1308]|uniref:alpha/beta fold hydrolase n=1 Tax=Nocardioides sp. zg-1308 TaxID=2736253 RepID=UPI001553087E|nr:alpha/beta hydrolase [Nocardioides sp. zg-1308]NPD06081.1 alpha/beta hydrolase [Nocardioides sp. zg-1308]
MTLLSASAATDLFRRPPSRFVAVPGTGAEVAVRTVGSGPDVVLVHGWPVSGATFRQLLPLLAEHLTCHVVDLVGAGQSRFDRSVRVGLDLHVSGVRAVLDDLGSDSVAVVGHDSGGLVARHAVADDPRLRALGLIDTEHTGRPAPLFRAVLAAGRLPGFGHALAWAALRPRVRRLPLVLGGAFRDDTLLGGEFEEFFLRPLHDDPDRRWAAGRLVASFDQGYLRDLESVHRRIAAPTQLVWGEHDPFLPVARARAMVATFPDARIHVVPRAKLFVHEEEPAQVAAALLPVLAPRAIRGAQ